MRHRPIRAWGNIKVAVAYVRASKDEQKLSPEVQRAAIEAWAGREGVTVASWCQEAICGETDNEARPELVRAMGEIGLHRAGVLVVLKRDRLARDVYVAATIERAVAAAGAKVVSADGNGNGDTPADAFMRHILDAAAEYELSSIRQRTIAALAAKKARGERVGEVPFGWAVGPDGKQLVEEPSEQRVRAAVIGMRKTGMKLWDIADQCKLLALNSRSGKPLQYTQVRRILASAGLVTAIRYSRYLPRAVSPVSLPATGDVRPPEIGPYRRPLSVRQGVDEEGRRWIRFSRPPSVAIKDAMRIGRWYWRSHDHMWHSRGPESTVPDLVSALPVTEDDDE